MCVAVCRRVRHCEAVEGQVDPPGQRVPMHNCSSDSTASVHHATHSERRRGVNFAIYNALCAPDTHHDVGKRGRVHGCDRVLKVDVQAVQKVRLRNSDVAGDKLLQVRVVVQLTDWIGSQHVHLRRRCQDATRATPRCQLVQQQLSRSEIRTPRPPHLDVVRVRHADQVRQLGNVTEDTDRRQNVPGIVRPVGIVGLYVRRTNGRPQHSQVNHHQHHHRLRVLCAWLFTRASVPEIQTPPIAAGCSVAHTTLDHCRNRLGRLREQPPRLRRCPL